MKFATVPKFKFFRKLNTAQQEATLVVDLKCTQYGRAYGGLHSSDPSPANCK